MHKIHIHIRPPHIDWHKYFTRKVIVLGGVAITFYVLGYISHSHYVFRGGEFAVGTLLEHLIFGVSTEEL